MKLQCAATLAVLSYAFPAAAATARDLQQRDHTIDEQTLCQPDVFRLCNDSVPDEDRIVVCMKSHHAQLSPECRRVFDAGIKKKPG